MKPATWLEQRQTPMLGASLLLLKPTIKKITLLWAVKGLIAKSDDFSEDKIEYNSLSASWIEIVSGFKVEVLPNIYMGMSARIHFLLSYNQPDNFDSLWIPGFNKKTDNSRFGLGYNYSISYFLPLYKKPKKNLEEQTSF